MIERTKAAGLWSSGSNLGRDEALGRWTVVQREQFGPPAHIGLYVIVQAALLRHRRHCCGTGATVAAQAARTERPCMAMPNMARFTQSENTLTNCSLLPPDLRHCCGTGNPA